MRHADDPIGLRTVYHLQVVDHNTFLNLLILVVLLPVYTLLYRGAVDTILRGEDPSVIQAPLHSAG